MKKIYTIAAGLLMANIAMSQSQAGKAVLKESRAFTIERNTGNRSITPNDTTGYNDSGNFLPVFAPNGTVTLFGYNTGGWVFGVNAETQVTLAEVAQGYLNLNETTVAIGEAIILFAGKTGISNNPTSKCVVKAHAMANNRAVNFDANNPNGSLNSKGPAAAVLAQADLLFNDIDTNFLSFNVVSFPQPAVVNGDFAIAVDFNDMRTKGDTAGLLSDRVGDAIELDYAFHKLNTSWFVSDFLFSASGTGSLDVNIAIFAVVENNFVNVESPDFFNGMKLGQNYPNPVTDISRIEFEIEKAANKLSLEIMDIKGQKVFEHAIYNQPAGRSHIDISATNLQAGVYYYSLICDGKRLTKKLIISK
ncbi:MAG: T9SS type A sorting domain-containing protein [Flavobacteriales bacterium]